MKAHKISGNDWNNPASRRRFLKRSGMATIGCAIASHSNTLLADPYETSAGKRLKRQVYEIAAGGLPGNEQASGTGTTAAYAAVNAIRSLLRDLITRNYLTQDLSSRVWENAVSGQVLKSIVIKVWTVSNPVDPGITTAEDLANTDPLIPLYTQIATTSGTPDTKVIIVDYKYGSP